MQTTHRLLKLRFTTLAILFMAVLLPLILASSAVAVDLPSELPLWPPGTLDQINRHDAPEKMRSARPPAGSLSGSNRVFSQISIPTYSLHRPDKPNGVSLVICPGGGFRDVWIDREGHDLALWLKKRGVTCLVLKYRTRSEKDISTRDAWLSYQRLVRTDGWQAIRVLRQQASDLGIQPHKIGICGFSAGGHLAIGCALDREPRLSNGQVSGEPDFVGLFYPGIPDDVDDLLKRRMGAEAAAPALGPFFIVNACNDTTTPVNQCIAFCTSLLKANVNIELHVFSTGSHGFDMGEGRGQSTALWPVSFAAWLHDAGLIQED